MLCIVKELTLPIPLSNVMVVPGLLQMMWFCQGTNQTTHAQHVYPFPEFLHSLKKAY